MGVEYVVICIASELRSAGFHIGLDDDYGHLESSRDYFRRRS